MKTIFSALFLFSLMLIGLPAHAGVEDPAFWHGLADKIPEASATLILIAGGVIDLLMRFVKTQKPLSILRLVAVALAGAAKVMDKLAKLLDAVLGQRAVNPADPVVPPKAE